MGVQNSNLFLKAKNSLCFDLAIWKYLLFWIFTNLQQDITPVDTNF